MSPISGGLNLKSKRRKKLWIVLLFISFITILYVSDKLFFFNFMRVDNTPLPLIGKSFSSPVKSIHFHETSAKVELNSRQACAVESAAIAHPGWQINVFFTGALTKENLKAISMNVLMKYDNIKLLRLNLLDYALQTPLESLVKSEALNSSKWQISHTSDVLRYLSLYKWGGVYLDLDVIVVRSLDWLGPNWAATEDYKIIAAGALRFSKDKVGRMMANATVRDFRINYRGDVWGTNGPGVITRALFEICDTKLVANMSARTCKGFAVYGPELFYPFGSTDAKIYFDTTVIPLWMPCVHHVWNTITGHLRLGKGSAYAKLAQQYCPKVFNAYGINFGL